MKKLYIVEVDESDIVECWNEQAVKEIGYQEYALKQCPGIKVKPYNSSGDCISREALKAKMFDIPKPKEGATFWNGVDTVGNLIDNAPTVEAYPFEQVQELVKLNQQFAQEIENLKRPKGGWLHHVEYTNDRLFYITECPFCKLRVHEETNFCPSCGADMKGGTE